jgi:glycosyltransferase involved in cell wall biosynthesis
MHLAVNATEIGRRRGGNEAYLAGLLEGLAELGASPKATLLLTDAGAVQLPAFLSSRFGQESVGDYRRIYFHLWQQTAILRRLAPDWYVSTFLLPPIVPCRAALLVHDLSFRSHPEYFPFIVAAYMRLLTALAIRRADRILTLSQFTMSELLRFHPDARSRALVVHPGVSKMFRPQEGARDGEVVSRLGIRPGYILAIGNIHPRKNLQRALDAYVRLCEERSDVPPMVWAGTERWGSHALLERARAAGVSVLGYVANDDLPALYRQALMLVYPSLYEGFGLPPLEGMACGTPSICSNASSLPEAVGDAALMVEPEDSAAIAAAMARLLEDRSLRETLRQAGFQRAARFGWVRTAEQMLASLQA